MKSKIILVLICCYTSISNCQHISKFITLLPGIQDSDFHIPDTHTFQYLIEEGTILSDGSVLSDRLDFAGYVPINGSSENGYLAINMETNIGGVAILDINFDSTLKAWNISNSNSVDFTPVVRTTRNCSGGITPWGTVLSCEENLNTADANNDGFHDIGWVVEIDPVNKQVIDKRWGMGKMRHENVSIHPNQQVFYQGADSAIGFLYKFVTDQAMDLSSGELFVYKGDKVSGGIWVSLGTFPSAIFDPNNVIAESSNIGATVFNGVEDVEYNPKDGMIYFAVKNESTVYRFSDPNPTTNLVVTNFETYVGGSSTTSYPIDNGTNVFMENWGSGNDNLAFDDLGNLWVYQDGGNDYIWFVEDGHTQSNPKVKIFGRTPAGSEPTGITFTPDNKFIFMTIQHPQAANNSSTILDAFDIPRAFNLDVTIVIARKEHLGNCHPNLILNGQPIDSDDYQAKNTITSNGKINFGETTSFTAGACIQLHPNFNVSLGADFTAQIQNCVSIAP